MNIVKRTLHKWFLVHFCTKEGDCLDTIVWGVPVENQNRFVMTSAVENVVPEQGDSSLVYTRNSIYRVLGKGTELHLPQAAAEMLRQGHNPDDVTKFHRLPVTPQRSAET
ncbi:hypothetical protein [Marinobacterium weihaiense]|uniref:Uncharacterized protein n=1 Tax=Marinobacterium weihaiense TaxID=2851016 RepID=A0ABS6MGA8_9GAMM|nr:hypothetical protein [Marinobacterium weihaiense]MBV0934894.1 hypothetical protein [Marinobacterium weihaiense]